MSRDLEEMDNWNPMVDDFKSSIFNSYQFPNEDADIHNSTTTTLHVKGIPRDMKESGLYNLFSNHGKVAFLPRIIRPKRDMQTTFAFVEMATEKDALVVIQALHLKQPHSLQIALTKKSENKIDERPPCLSCGRPSDLFCSICNGKYCSQKCQLEDWPKHRGFCKSYVPKSLGKQFRDRNKLVKSPSSEVENETTRKCDTSDERNNIDIKYQSDFILNADCQNGILQITNSSPYGSKMSNGEGKNECKYNSNSSFPNEDGSLVLKAENVKGGKSINGKLISFASLSLETEKKSSKEGKHSKQEDKSSGNLYLSDRPKPQVLETKIVNRGQFQNGELKSSAASSSPETGMQSQTNTNSIKSPIREIFPGTDLTSEEQDRVFSIKVPQLARPKQGAKVMPVSVNSTNEIFVQLFTKENVENLKQLTSELLPYCEKMGGYLLSPYLPKVGELVGSKYDNIWCRGEVISFTGNMVELYFVDFGNKESVQNDEIVPLKPSLAKFPAAGFKIKLADVPCQPITEETFEILSGIVNVLHTVNFECTPTSELVAWLINNNTNQNVNNAINVILHESSSPIRIAEIESLHNNFEQDKIVECIKTKYSIENCQTVHLPLEKPITVAVMHVEGPVIMCNLLDDLLTIDHLVDKITADMASKPSTGYKPDLKEVCLAKFPGDGRWYRAACLETSAFLVDHAYVLYVDYGNMGHIPFENIRPMESKYMNLELQAVPCIVPGVKPQQLSKLKDRLIEIEAFKEQDDYMYEIRLVEILK